MNEVSLSIQGPRVINLILLKNKTNTTSFFGQSLYTWKNNLGGMKLQTFHHWSKCFYGLSVWVTKKKLLQKLQSENGSDLKALRILLRVTSAQIIFKWKVILQSLPYWQMAVVRLTLPTMTSVTPQQREWSHKNSAWGVVENLVFEIPAHP